MTSETKEKLVYRITGPQSIERLERLVPLVIPDCVSVCSGKGSKEYLLRGSDEEVGSHAKSKDKSGEAATLHFVWETACEQTWRERHNAALVLNKLHNVTILEDKSNLAFLQLRIQDHYKNVLPTYVANGVNELLSWSENHWSTKKDETSDAAVKSHDDDWWVVKASKGNGGKDIWVISSDNFRTVIENELMTPKGTTSHEVPMKTEEYVIQKYVPRPMLYKGKKFHFRCYSLLRADMSALFYHMAYILTAGYNYNKSTDASSFSPGDNESDMDIRKLITNLSVNKHIEGYPGQVPCNIATVYPQIYHQLCLLWKGVARAVTPFMSKQISKNNFEFFGIDVIADIDGNCWLLEVNRLPGLESSSLNTADEDVMYDTMMTSLLRIVLQPLQSKYNHSNNSNMSSDDEQQHNDTNYGLWEIVHAPSDNERILSSKGLATVHPGASDKVPPILDESNYNGDVWKNIFSWRAFTKKRSNREQIVLSAAAIDSAEIDTKIEKEKYKKSNQNTCAAENCSLPAPFQCSRCKLTYYCSAEHQKQDWKTHKNTKCKTKVSDPTTSSATSPPKAPSQGTPQKASKGSTTNSGETRQSRCMFCGENIIMTCESDAVKHMETCVALQEQLGKPEEQFTIPKALREKGVTLHDVKNAPQL
jgi:hypothetical protein